jgi:heat-inducible transcriptional repressor
MTELDERKGAILRAIVERYVEAAQPVGSQTVAQAAGLRVSAATVRNEMGALEREGYIAQPHTSAGRVPTDRGYRYYVDNFAGTATLPADARKQVAEFFTAATRAIDELLHETSQLLSRLTHHAALVVGPQSEAVRIRSAHLAQLQPNVLLAVVVLSNGAVEKEIVLLDADARDDDVAAASARLARLLDGATLADPPVPEAGPAADAADGLVRAACDAIRRHTTTHAGEPLYVGGASLLAAEPEAFRSAAHAARLLQLLEQHAVVTALLRELLGPGLTIRIGSENEQVDLQECSLVLAPFLVEGEVAGTVGVLGPTRMDYRKARAAVATVSQQLGRQLTA